MIAAAAVGGGARLLRGRLVHAQTKKTVDAFETLLEKRTRHWSETSLVSARGRTATTSECGRHDTASACFRATIRDS